MLKYMYIHTYIHICKYVNIKYYDQYYTTYYRQQRILRNSMLKKQQNK